MPTQCLAPHVQRNEQGLRMAQFMADYLVGLYVLMVQAHLHIRIADGLQAQELVQGTYLALIGVVLALGNAELAVFQGLGDSPCTCHWLRSGLTYFPLSERACIWLNPASYTWQAISVRERCQSACMAKLPSRFPSHPVSPGS